ncbi:MAG: hypothetical protein H6722_22540 [Sandaracinus sp.]|nr:hypothetical protein [Myxococcales bacterium]MCB9615225.1 hypothetical protein [Sandaracinus sp.]
MRAFFLMSVVLWGCDPSAPVEDEMPRPDASVLRFDAAMLDPSTPDGGPPPPPIGRDAGREVRRDAGTSETRYVCRGVPTSCSLVSRYSCTDQRGCRLEGDCTGVARGCYGYFDRYSCPRQDGCYWSTYTDSCSGSAQSCLIQYGELSCEDQDGCRWEESCGGVASSCSSFFTSSSCYGQRGCRWEVE